MRAGSADRWDKEGGEGHLRRALTYAVQDYYYKRSALHYASSSGLESIVAKLLSLGADAALIDAVRACSYMNTFMHISFYVFTCME